MGDQPTAIALYASILTGLYRREKTGQGCHVSTALLAVGTWTAATLVQAALDGAEFYDNIDRKNPPNALLNSYQTSDGRWFMLVAEGVRRWPALINAVGHPEWASDERFSERSGRAVHAGALTRLLEEAFAAHPFEYWAAALDKAWIPYSLIYTIEENAHTPQLFENNFVVPIADGSETPNYTVDSPIFLEEETKVPPRVAPDLGQHTLEVLKQLAYDEQQIEAMRTEGVI
jgi:crotonobetainyl-CoA:carnitine CoA-transferase CaiB-like acyl-CoA transferase